MKLKILFWEGPSQLGKWLTIKASTQLEKAQQLRKNTQVYIVLQFSLLMLGTVAFMAFFDELSLGYRLGFLSLMIWTMWSISALLEKKKWVNWTEIPRLLIICSYLNMMYYLQFINWFNVFLIASASATVLILIWWIWHWKTESQTKII
jgi:hypothetical protein